MVSLVSLRQAEHVPVLTLGKVAAEVSLVQALHDDDARLGLETSGVDGAVIPGVDLVHLAQGVRLRLRRPDGVVDDDAVTVIAGSRRCSRSGGKAMPSVVVQEVVLGVARELELVPQRSLYQRWFRSSRDLAAFCQEREVA